MATAWAVAVWDKTADMFTEIWPALLLLPLAAIGWFGGRRLLRLAESSFWSLNALAVQPVYVIFREGLRHLAEALLPARDDAALARGACGALSAAVSGVVVCALGIGVVALLWPATRWVGSFAGAGSAHLMVPVAAGEQPRADRGLSARSPRWSGASATRLMAQPRDLAGFRRAARATGAGVSRICPTSTRSASATASASKAAAPGPRGNERLRQTLARLDAIHADAAAGFVLITGDLTDAGRSAEWAEFFIALGGVSGAGGTRDRAAGQPRRQRRRPVAARPGWNCGCSPMKRLRQLRTHVGAGAPAGRPLRSGRRAGVA